MALLAVALLHGDSALAQTDGHHPEHDPMAGLLYVGNHAPYPNLTEAARADRRRAHKLRRETLRWATTFDTVEEARRRGYVGQPELSPLYQPGLQHLRRNGLSSAGGLLRPWRPQALVFWCPSLGDCQLAAAMYRAAPRRTPPTYGGLLGWHRHGAGWSWMTHVWLTDTTRTSLAQCAPFNAMRRYNPLLSWEPYRPDAPVIDEPCLDTVGLH